MLSSDSGWNASGAPPMGVAPLVSPESPHAQHCAEYFQAYSLRPEAVNHYGLMVLHASCSLTHVCSFPLENTVFLTAVECGFCKQGIGSVLDKNATLFRVPPAEVSPFVRAEQVSILDPGTGVPAALKRWEDLWWPEGKPQAVSIFRTRRCLHLWPQPPAHCLPR